MCEALGVSETGYYRFVRAMAKPDKDELLSAEIKKVLDESPYNDNYGVPRMQLALEQRGIKVGLRRLKRIMREHGWLHEKRRRPHGITKANPEAMITENWKCQVLCSLKTHKNQFGIGTEQLDRYLSSFCAVREGRKFSRRGLCRAGSVVA